MSNLTCPKCGGSDYFLSKRNIVKGMGWAQRGSLKSVPVCRVCDEIMDGAPVGMFSWEDLGSSKSSWGIRYTRNDGIIFGIALLFYASFVFVQSSITYVLMWLGLGIFIVRMVQILGKRKSQK
jgi:hypothetical protein